MPQPSQALRCACLTPVRALSYHTVSTLAPPGQAWEHLTADGTWEPYDVSVCEHLRIAAAAGCEDPVVRLETAEGLMPARFDLAAGTVLMYTAGGDTEQFQIRQNAARALPTNHTALGTSSSSSSSSGSGSTAVVSTTSAAHHAQEVALAADCTHEVAADESCAGTHYIYHYTYKKIKLGKTFTQWYLPRLRTSLGPVL
jgi:hypothetical protein